jgi:hypothetical protein
MTGLFPLCFSRFYLRQLEDGARVPVSVDDSPAGKDHHRSSPYLQPGGKTRPLPIFFVGKFVQRWYIQPVLSARKHGCRCETRVRCAGHASQKKIVKLWLRDIRGFFLDCRPPSHSQDIVFLIAFPLSVAAQWLRHNRSGIESMMKSTATMDFPWRRGTASVFGVIVSPGYPAITGL